MTIISNGSIRKSLRSQRAQLSKQQLEIASRDLGKQFNLHRTHFYSATKIASYLQSNGEISPCEITASLPSAQFFLPQITNIHRSKMAFYPSSNKLISNRFNILEPSPDGTPANLRSFDIILVPLVAFDRSGNRLGMGCGFYDRAFAFKNTSSQSHRPRLIGLAHHFQEVDAIIPQPWDVPLDAILTDREFIKISI